MKHIYTDSHILQQSQLTTSTLTQPVNGGTNVVKAMGSGGFQRCVTGAVRGTPSGTPKL